jgi:hypothetical protein
MKASRAAPPFALRTQAWLQAPTYATIRGLTSVNFADIRNSGPEKSGAPQRAT